MKTENDIIIIIIHREVTRAHPRCERPPELDRRPPWQLGCADSKSTNRRGSGQKCDAEKPPKKELRVTRIVKGSTIPKTWNRNGSWLKLMEVDWNWKLMFTVLLSFAASLSFPLFPSPGMLLHNWHQNLSAIFFSSPGGIRGSVHGITLLEREWFLQILAFQLQKCGERRGRVEWQEETIFRCFSWEDDRSPKKTICGQFS